MSSINIKKYTVKGGNKFNATHTVNFYIIYNNYESILIDTGFPENESSETLLKAIDDFKITKAIVTHYHEDHSGGVKILSDKKIKFFYYSELNISNKHPLNNEKYGFKLKNNITLTFNGFKLKLLHTPGHAYGHISVYLEEEQILFSGDNIVGEGTTWIGPPDGDMKIYLNTVGNLKKLKLQKIYPGHGEIIDKPYDKIDFLISHRLNREQKIIEAMKEGLSKIDDITRKAYENDNLPEYIFHFAKLTVLAHLDKLIKEGKVYLIDINEGVFKLENR